MKPCVMQLRVVLLEHPHRPEGVARFGSSTRMLNEPCPEPVEVAGDFRFGVPSATVLIVTARSGTSRLPAFLIASWRSLTSASRWWFGNFAFVTWTGKLPDGSVDVLALAAAARRHADTGAGRAAAIPVAILASGPRSRRLPAFRAALPQGAGNIPSARRAIRASLLRQMLATRPEKVRGGGEGSMDYIYLSVR